jgi:hypothetical protein
MVNLLSLVTGWQTESSSSEKGTENRPLFFFIPQKSLFLPKIRN